jgi:flagellar biosynthetic protein FliO
MADQSIAMVLLRLVIAVVVVVALLLLTAKLTRKIGIKTDGSTGPSIRLVSRQPLSRNASIAVVRAGDRTLVLGVTDHTVTLLSDQDSSDYPEPETTGRRRNAPAEGVAGPYDRSSADGNDDSTPKASGLMGKLRERTVRRPS